MGRIVEALAQRPPPFPCVFLLGRAFRHRQALLERAKRLPATFAFREHDWAEILRARATFCAFGVSIYELLALGVPCAVTAHSRENDEGARVLCQRFPVVPYLGFEETLTHESMLGALAQLEATPAEAWAPFAVMKQATTHVAQKLLAFASVAKGGRPPLGP
jgi:spore coat polysaccharide biosynthesis predicted glycosyltransferase SpsG